MDSNTFMGLLIAAIVVLLTGISIIAKVFIGPVISLNKNIVLLQSSIGQLKEKDEEITSKLESQDNKIENMDHRLIKVESKFEVKRRV